MGVDIRKLPQRFFTFCRYKITIYANSLRTIEKPSDCKNFDEWKLTKSFKNPQTLMSDFFLLNIGMVLELDLNKEETNFSHEKKRCLGYKKFIKFHEKKNCKR